MLRKLGGVEIDGTALRGEVIGALTAHAAAVAADMVVIASHGRAGAARVWFGSVAEALVRALDIPVLVVRQTTTLARPFEPRDIRTVVVPLDGSPVSESVIPLLLRVADPPEMDVRLVRVLSSLAARSHGRSGTPVEERRERRQADPESLLRTVAAEVRLLGPHVAPIVLTGGNPAREVAEYARDVGADLIAMTTHGRSGVRRLVLGSVAADIMHETLTPVLLFRPTAQTVLAGEAERERAAPAT